MKLDKSRDKSLLVTAALVLALLTIGGNQKAYADCAGEHLVCVSVKGTNFDAALTGCKADYATAQKGCKDEASDAMSVCDPDNARNCISDAKAVEKVCLLDVKRGGKDCLNAAHADLTAANAACFASLHACH